MTRITLMFGLLILAGTQAAAQTTCPAATTRSDRVINRLLTSPEHADTRQKYGVGVVSATGIRKLVDSTDAARCQRLHEVLRSRSTTGTVDPSQWQPTFYSANGRLYIVAAPKPPVVTRVSPDTIRISLMWTPTYIVDASTYAVIGSIGM